MKKGYFGIREGGSHQLGLLYAVKHTSKPILELGAGESSTVQIHEATKNRILTIESHPHWLSRFTHLRSENHSLVLMSSFQMLEFFKEDTTEWGLVFVDCQGGNWAERQAAIKKYKDIADYIVVHDTEYSAVMNFFGRVVEEKRNFSKEFKYWIEFHPVGMTDVPATVLASNKIDLKDVNIEGIIVINRNK